jgi:hypothetical protein
MLSSKSSHINAVPVPRKVKFKVGKVHHINLPNPNPHPLSIPTLQWSRAKARIIDLREPDRNQVVRTKVVRTIRLSKSTSKRMVGGFLPIKVDKVRVIVIKRPGPPSRRRVTRGDEILIGMLVEQRCSHLEIARSMGLSPATILRILKRVPNTIQPHR